MEEMEDVEKLGVSVMVESGSELSEEDEKRHQEAINGKKAQVQRT